MSLVDEVRLDFFPDMTLNSLNTGTSSGAARFIDITLNTGTDIR